jgi:hypothetical protein
VDRGEILRVLGAFEAAGLDYVLIGATAMGVHGLIRATEDIDLFVNATADNIERLRAALSTAYDADPNIQDISTDDLLGEYPGSVLSALRGSVLRHPDAAGRDGDLR